MGRAAADVRVLRNAHSTAPASSISACAHACVAHAPTPLRRTFALPRFAESMSQVAEWQANACRWRVILSTLRVKSSLHDAEEISCAVLNYQVTVHDPYVPYTAYDGSVHVQNAKQEISAQHVLHSLAVSLLLSCCFFGTLSMLFI